MSDYLKLPPLVRGAGGKAGIWNLGSLGPASVLWPLCSGASIGAAVAPGMEMCLNSQVRVEAKRRLDTECSPLRALQNFYSQKLKWEKALRDHPGSIAKLFFATECFTQNSPAKKV